MAENQYTNVKISEISWQFPKSGAFFFTVIGMNSITIYMAQRFIRFSYTSEKLFGGIISLLPENSQTFFTQAAYICVCWLFLYVLYRNKIFLKV